MKRLALALAMFALPASAAEPTMVQQLDSNVATATMIVTMMRAQILQDQQHIAQLEAQVAALQKPADAPKPAQ